MVKPAVYRQAVGFIQAEFEVSQRRACRILAFARSSMTYEFAAYKLGPEDEDTLMVTATQTNVLIDHDDRSTIPIPDVFRAAVSGAEGAEL